MCCNLKKKKSIETMASFISKNEGVITGVGWSNSFFRNGRKASRGMSSLSS